MPAASSAPACSSGPCSEARSAAWRMRSRNTPPSAGAYALIGMVTAAQLESAVDQGASNRPLSQILTRGAGLSAHDFPHVHADHSLDIALQRMGAMHLDVLPVVRRDNLRRLVGIVTLSGVLGAFGIERSRAAG